MRFAKPLARSILGAVLSSSLAFAGGPFGINAGDRVWENPACRATSGSMYLCAPPPAVDPLFDSFQAVVVIAAADIGACQVMVHGPVLTRRQVREPGNKPMDEAALYLRARYGESFTKYDVVPTDTEMAKPEMWWVSIVGDDRDYRYVWNEDSGYVPVDRVILVAMQYRFVDKGPYVLVTYRFDNADECLNAMQASDGRTP